MGFRAVVAGALLAMAHVSAQAQEARPASSAPPASVSAPRLAVPVWEARPDVADYERFYPSAAVADGIAGSAALDCLVGEDGRLRCVVVREEPEGYGFGQAALRVADEFRMALQLEDGTPTVGGRFRPTILFQVAE